MNLHGLVVNLLYTNTLSVLSKRTGSERRQKDNRGRYYLEFLTTEVLSRREKLVQFLNDLDSVLMGHFEVKNQQVNRLVKFLVWSHLRETMLECFFDQVNNFLTVARVCDFFNKAEIGEIGL